MIDDDLSKLVDEAFPSCPHCGELLDDAGLDDQHPHWVCRSCTLGVVPPG